MGLFGKVENRLHFVSMDLSTQERAGLLMLCMGWSRLSEKQAARLAGSEQGVYLIGGAVWHLRRALEAAK